LGERIFMGTSVEMIENFYGKKRVRDPKMATEITKGSRAVLIGAVGARGTSAPCRPPVALSIA
jgi:hypothetical protein